jgi:prefoldin subunit 5
MGKKDKADKSKKKKNKTGAVAEPESEAIQPAAAEPEAGNTQYDEYVTAADVMALISSLEQGLDRLEISNQMLQQRIAQLHPAPRRHKGALGFFALILVVGILVTGYYGFRMNANIEENGANSAADINRISARIDTIDASIRTISSDLNNFNSSLELLSANMSTINQNVNNIASSARKLDAGAAGSSYDSRYYARPQITRQPWR